MITSNDPLQTEYQTTPDQTSLEQAAEASSSAAQETVGRADQMGAAGADFAQEVGRQASDAISTAAAASADAFEQARNGLQATTPPVLADEPLPDPFRAGTAFFQTIGTPNYAKASQTVADLNAKILRAWQTNAQSALEHWKKLVGVKSMADLIALNSEFSRKQLDAFNEQSRELVEIAGRMTRQDTKSG